MIGDSLSDPDPDHPYDQIKRHLKSIFKKSQFERDLDVINIPADGTERPTYIWDKMAQSMPDSAHRTKPCSMVKSIFFAKIDPSIRDHVMYMPYDRFREVAEKADELWNNHKKKHEVVVMKVLENMGEKSSPENNNNEPILQVNQPNDYCYYHRTWGNQAKNCRPPCKASSTAPKNGSKQRRN